MSVLLREFSFHSPTLLFHRISINERKELQLCLIFSRLQASLAHVEVLLHEVFLQFQMTQPRVFGLFIKQTVRSFQIRQIFLALLGVGPSLSVFFVQTGILVVLPDFNTAFFAAKEDSFPEKVALGSLNAGWHSAWHS